MNFRFAHRRGASVSRARRLCGACAALAAAIVLSSASLAACGRPAGRVQAVSVDERLDIGLSDGRTVRLGGLDAPNADRGAPEIAKAARDFLGERLLGRRRGPYPVRPAEPIVGQDGRRPFLPPDCSLNRPPRRC